MLIKCNQANAVINTPGKSLDAGFRHVYLVLAILICQVASAAEIDELLNRAAKMEGAQYWAIACGPQWTADQIKDLGELVQREPRQWLARAWYVRLHVPAAGALSERVDLVLKTCGAEVTTSLNASVVGPHIWSSDKALVSMHEQLTAAQLTIPDHFVVVTEALIHPRQPVSSVAVFQLMHEILLWEPISNRGIHMVRVTNAWNGRNGDPEDTKILQDIRAGCLVDAPPEVGIPLASAICDDIGKRYLETQANRSGVTAALAGLYRGAQRIADQGVYGQRVLMDGVWSDEWLNQVDPATVTALTEMLSPDPVRVENAPDQHRFLVTTGPGQTIDLNALGPVLRLHEAQINPGVIQRYQAHVASDCTDVMEMLVDRDIFDEEDGNLPRGLVDQIDSLLAAPSPQTADKLHALEVKSQHGLRFRNELVTRLRTGRKARYPSGVELQHYQEFLYPVKVLREEP